jgi:hypothetical protein
MHNVFALFYKLVKVIPMLASLGISRVITRSVLPSIFSISNDLSQQQRLKPAINDVIRAVGQDKGRARGEQGANKGVVKGEAKGEVKGVVKGEVKESDTGFSYLRSAVRFESKEDDPGGGALIEKHEKRVFSSNCVIRNFRYSIYQAA